MSILAVIPARYNSTRFPGKPLVDINGVSMIQRVYEKLKDIDVIDRIIIATDDERIFKHVKSFNAEVMMTSEKHNNGTERIAEVVAKIDNNYSAVINVQGDEPFINENQVIQLAKIILEENTDIATLAKLITHEDELASPNTVKVVFDNNMNALYFSRAAIPYARNLNKQVSVYKHIGIYAFKTKVLQEVVKMKPSKLEEAESLEQLRWLENMKIIKIGITEFESFGIDTIDDIEEALKKL